MAERPTLRAVKTPEGERAPIHGSGKRPKHCDHDQVMVDPVERRVTCDDCHAEIDPYRALHHLSMQIDRYDYSVRRARDELQVVRAQVDEAKRIERNTKARLRKVVKQLPLCDCKPDTRETNRIFQHRFCPKCGGAR